MKMRFCFKIKGKKEKLVCEIAEVRKDPLGRKQYDEIKQQLKKKVASKFGCKLEDIEPMTLNGYLNAIGK